MAQSMNTKVDYTASASSFSFLGSQGKVMVGDVAFEYYNSNNVEDYIQIPWDEIAEISCSVWFGKWITRFVIFTKKNGKYGFSARNNKELLRAVREHFPEEKITKSLTFFQVIFRGIKYLPQFIKNLF